MDVPCRVQQFICDCAFPQHQPEFTGNGRERRQLGYFPLGSVVQRCQSDGRAAANDSWSDCFELAVGQYRRFCNWKVVLMRISFSPQRRDHVLIVSKNGDVLTINDETFDFSALPNGATLLA